MAVPASSPGQVGSSAWGQVLWPSYLSSSLPQLGRTPVRSWDRVWHLTSKPFPCPHLPSHLPHPPAACQPPSSLSNPRRTAERRLPGDTAGHPVRTMCQPFPRPGPGLRQYLLSGKKSHRYVKLMVHIYQGFSVSVLSSGPYYMHIVLLNLN